jgi:alpha-ribazole phosphatase
MEIYLIRHTRPAVAKGVCYGQADIDVTETFLQEASIIQAHLPQQVAVVHSSPLQRCSKLATHLFPTHTLQLHNSLMEINCGHWELQAWNDIPAAETAPWMADFVNVRIPGGENYIDLYDRVQRKFFELAAQVLPAVIVAHGGVIRSILSAITDTPLQDSFQAFTLHYGCVIKLWPQGSGFGYQILSNIPHEKETHKPQSQ